MHVHIIPFRLLPTSTPLHTCQVLNTAPQKTINV